jgi:hypothetical protein
MSNVLTSPGSNLQFHVFASQLRKEVPGLRAECKSTVTKGTEA